MKRPRKAMQSTNASDAGPRRSLRLAKNRETLRAQEESQELGTLPYYMEAVEGGLAGRGRDRSQWSQRKTVDCPLRDTESLTATRGPQI